MNFRRVLVAAGLCLTGLLFQVLQNPQGASIPYNLKLDSSGAIPFYREIN